MSAPRANPGRWFHAIENAWTHEDLSRVAAALAAEHKRNGVKWFDTLLERGKERRELIDRMEEMDAEYLAIVRGS